MFNLTAYKTTPYGGSTATTSYTTNAMNEYTAIGSHSLTYTDAGSLADDGAYLYTYDAHQHLIEVKLKSNSSVVATYTYDALGLGRRIGKVVGSATTRYVHAGVQAIEEYDGTGSTANLRRLYVFGERIDQVVAMEAPDAADIDQDSNTTEVLRFSFHTQLIGSVTQVTAPSGSVAESYEYDPYGKPTIKDGGGSTISASAIGNSTLCTARQLDAETGLYYCRARHCSADLRRLIQRDPLEHVDGPNAVSYVCSSPSARTDPYGLEGEEADSGGKSQARSADPLRDVLDEIGALAQDQISAPLDDALSAIPGVELIQTMEALEDLHENVARLARDMEALGLKMEKYKAKPACTHESERRERDCRCDCALALQIKLRGGRPYYAHLGHSSRAGGRPDTKAGNTDTPRSSLRTRDCRGICIVACKRLVNSLNAGRGPFGTGSRYRRVRVRPICDRASASR